MSSKGKREGDNFERTEDPEYSIVVIAEHALMNFMLECHFKTPKFRRLLKLIDKVCDDNLLKPHWITSS